MMEAQWLRTLPFVSTVYFAVLIVKHRAIVFSGCVRSNGQDTAPTNVSFMALTCTSL